MRMLNAQRFAGKTHSAHRSPCPSRSSRQPSGFHKGSTARPCDGSHQQTSQPLVSPLTSKFSSGLTREWPPRLDEPYQDGGTLVRPVGFVILPENLARNHAERGSLIPRSGSPSRLAKTLTE